MQRGLYVDQELNGGGKGGKPYSVLRKRSGADAYYPDTFSTHPDVQRHLAAIPAWRAAMKKPVAAGRQPANRLPKFSTQ